MNAAKLKTLSARVPFSLGVVALIVGVLDPLEGSVIILSGGGLIAFGTWLGNADWGLFVYRTWLFGMMAVGIIALFGLSAAGGLGGKSGHSLWWGLLLLPYPLGWILSVANLISRMIDRMRHRLAR